MDTKNSADKKTENTLSELSVNSILMELSDVKTYGSDFTLDDVLAEFGSGIKVEKADSEEIIKPKQADKHKNSPRVDEPAEEAAVAKEEKKLKKPSYESEIKTTEIEFKQGELNNENGERSKPKRISRVIKPWEDGVYGDARIPEVEPEKKRKNKPLKREDYQLSFNDVIPEYELPDTVEEYISDVTKHKNNHRIRTLLALLLCLPLCYLSFYSIMGWYMPDFIAYLSNPFRFLFAIVLLQCAIMLVCVDIIAKGFMALFTLKPSLDSALAFSSLMTLIHTIIIMIKPEWGGWLPYSAITSFTLMLAMHGGYLKQSARLRSCKALVAVKNPSGVILNADNNETFAHKVANSDIKAFLRHLNDSDGAESAWMFLSPVSIVATLAFAAVASFGTGAAHNFFWAAAAISSVSVPFFAALSFSLPFAKVAKQQAGVGAVICGWFSAAVFPRRLKVTLRDADLYPKGTVILHGLKMLGSYPLEKTLSYAASIVNESDSGLKYLFNDLLKSQFVNTESVRRLKYHEAGGIEAEINNDSVLIGTAAFMFRTGIRVHDNVNVKNAIFIAINMELAGVFNINYKVNPEIRRGLMSLIRKKITPVLAAIDFNLTPVMVETDFKLPIGSVEYPEVEDRIYLANEYQHSKLDPAALVTRSGLYPYSSAILSSMRLRKVTFRNIVLSGLCIMIGMIVMFYLTYTQSMESAAPANVFLYLLLWYIPMYLLSIRVGRF